MNDGSQAIGGAGGVGYHIVVGLVVLGVVHAANLKDKHLVTWLKANNDDIHNI